MTSYTLSLMDTPSPFWPQMFLPFDARSAKRGMVIVSRPSVRPSLRPTVTLMYRGRMCWVSSKVIARVVSLASSLPPRRHNVGKLIQGEHP